MAASMIVAQMVTQFAIMPALIKYGVKEAFRNATQPSEEEKKKRFWQNMGVAGLELLPGMRNVGDYAFDSMTEARPYPYHLLPVEDMFTRGVQSVVSASKLATEEGREKFRMSDAHEMFSFALQASKQPRLVDTWVFNLYQDLQENGHADLRDLFTAKTKH